MIKAVSSYSTNKTDKQETDKTPKYDNPDSKGTFDKSKKYTKVLAELITQATNGTSLTNRCNYQVLRIK